MKNLIFFLSVYLMSNYAFAQNHTSFLNQLREKYEGVTDLHSKITIDKPNGEKESIELWFNASHNKLITADFETMLTPQYFLIVDKVGKSINLQEIDGRFEKQDFRKSQLPIDSLIKHGKSVMIDTLKNRGIVKVAMKLEHPVIENVVLMVDLKMILKEMVYDYHDPYNGIISRVKMNYQIFDIKPILNEEQFDVSNYVTKVAGYYSPSERFADYKINVVTKN